MAIMGLFALIIVLVVTIVVVMLQVWLHMRVFQRRMMRNYRTAFDQIPAGGPVNAVVFLAYRRLAENLRRYGVVRLESETVRQFLARVPEHLPADGKALRGFLDVFERARYSDRPCGEPERDRAIAALRAVQHSLEKVVLSPAQLLAIANDIAKGGGPIEPSPGTLKEMGLRVVAPFVPGPADAAGGQDEKHRQLVPPRDAGRAELLRKLGPSNVKEDARLPKEDAGRLEDALARRDHPATGRLLLELAGGPAQGRRVHVDPSLASYLLEFERRLAESGRSGRESDPNDCFVIALAATVLAIYDGRDFLVPDDLKLALVGAGPFVCHVKERDIVFVLDEEIREGRQPRGPEFMMPPPLRVRGLMVPAV